MADKVERVVLAYALDNSINTTKAGLKTLVREQNAVTDALVATNKQSLSLEEAGQKLNKQFAELAREKAIRQIALNFQTAEKEGIETAKALELVADQLALIGASDSEIRQVARSLAQVADQGERAGRASLQAVSTSDAFGKTSTGIGSIASVAGGIAGSGAGAGLQLAGDVAGAAEQIPALVSGIAALGPVGLAAGVAAAGLTAVLGNQIDQNRKLTESINERLQLESEVFELVHTSTREQLQATQEATAEQLELQRVQLQSAKQRLEQIQQEQSYTNSIFDEARKNVGLAFPELKAQEDEVNRLQSAYDAALTRVIGFNEGLLTNATAAKDAEEAEKKLAESRDTATQKLAQLQEQGDSIAQAAVETAIQTAEDRNLRLSREEEDFQLGREQRLESHQSNLAKIEQAGMDRLAQIRDQGNNQIAQSEKEIGKIGDALAKVTVDANKTISKINQTYMASELKAFEQFRRQEKRLTQDANRDRLRSLEDLHDSLSQAESENDVVSFIRLKQEGEKRIKRESEDAIIAEKRRAEDFLAERQAAEEARQLRIADIQAAAAERKADLEVQLAERKAAHEALKQEIQDQLDTEKARIAATAKAAQDAFDQQLEREDAARKLRLDRQVEDEGIADRRRLAALNKQLGDIDTKAAREQQAAGIIGNAYIAMAGRIDARVRQILATASTSSSSTPLVSSGGGGGLAFAEGGVARRPTLALIGEKPGRHEAVIPFSPSRGLASELASLGLGGNPVQINGDIILGNLPDGVTADQVKGWISDGLHELGYVIIKGINQQRTA